jgi:hypothetical protein
VIDVGTRDGSQEPYIYISQKGESGAWLTLSHCWGKTATYVTNQYNLASGSRSLPYTDPPPTFKDAIKVTRLLGFRYLWIDSICILQGSDTEAQKDWLAESRRMRDYYKECVLCIAADDAPSDEEGFLNTRPDENFSPFQSVSMGKWKTMQYIPWSRDFSLVFKMGLLPNSKFPRMDASRRSLIPADLTLHLKAAWLGLSEADRVRVKSKPGRMADEF